MADFADAQMALSGVTEASWMSDGRLIAVQHFSAQGLALAALCVRAILT
jgi:hypothetical protein